MSTRDYAVSVLASLSEKKLKEFIMLFADENTIARMESDLIANDSNSKRYSSFEEIMQEMELTENEKNLAESYARLHSLSVDEAFKKALFEKIEEEFDLAVAEEAYNEYLESGKQSRNIAELWKEIFEERDKNKT